MDGTPRSSEAPPGPEVAEEVGTQRMGWRWGGGQVRSEDRGVSGSGTRVGECEPFRVKAVVGKELKCVSEKGKTS